MSKKYYTLPLNAINFITNIAHEKCSINESIAHHIHLITTSYFGECSFDELFGCSFWIIDFDNLKSHNNIKELILKSLKSSLRRHEKRLYKINITVNIKQEEIEFLEKGTKIKKRIDINIKGNVKKTNEVFKYFEYFYIGPLSY